MSEKEFLNILEKNQNIIHKVCLIYSKNQDDHDDLFQDIVYQCWKSFKSFKGESKISTWLYRVALYTALTQVKKSKADMAEYGKELVFERLEDTTESNIKKLYSLIEHLKPADKALIILYLEDKSYEEMAEILGYSISNVGVRINRIKKKLSELWS